MQTEVTNAWDQLDDEGSLAYGLFLIYSNMPPQDRSRRAVIAETIRICPECNSGEPTLSQALAKHTCRGAKIIHKVANKYKWTKRAHARDRFLAKAEEAAVIKSLQKTAARRAQEWSAFSERVWELSTRLLDKVSAILDLPITEQQITEVAGQTFVDFETGQQRHEKIINITVKPVRTSPKDASQMLRDADTLARLAVGKETAIFGFDVTGAAQKMLAQARAALVSLRDEYATNPAMLELLPDLVSERFEVDKKLLLETNAQGVIETAEPELHEYTN